MNLNNVELQSWSEVNSGAAGPAGREDRKEEERAEPRAVDIS